MKKLLSYLLIGVIFIGGGIFFYIESTSNKVVSKNYEVELDGIFDPTSPIQLENKDKVSFSGKVDTSNVGTYDMTYTYNGKDYICKVNVVDQVAPEFTLKEGTLRLNVIDSKIDTLVENCNDQSEVTYYLDGQKITKIGDYEVTVVAKDESGNTAKQTTTIHVIEPDTTAPELTGLSDVVMKKNEAVNFYSNVMIKDDLDEHPYYEIDLSNLDYSKEGDYTITYKAYDDCENVKEYSRKVTVTNEESPTNRVIYLTFDDGPSRNTPEILKILDQYHVKATFFVTGANPGYYDYYQKVNEAGHALAIHTMNHDYPKIYASLDAYVADFNEIRNLIQSYVGYYVNIYRFPGGSSNHESMKYCDGVVSQIAAWANENHYEYYDWNVVSGDGNVRTSVPDMINIVKNSRQYDSIMLLCHDAGAAINTVKALPTIIQYYLSLGYTFKIIDQNTPEFHHTIAN